MFIFPTIGIMTADEVPPKMAPNMKLTAGLSFKIHQPDIPITKNVTKKLISVNMVVPFNEFINVLKLNLVPLSNNNTISVI